MNIQQVYSSLVFFTIIVLMPCVTQNRRASFCVLIGAITYNTVTVFTYQTIWTSNQNRTEPIE